MTIFLIGCGRLGFDAAAPTDAAPDAVITVADDLPCDMPVLLDSGGHLAHDTLAWVNDAAGDWLVGVEHMSQDVPQIQRHALGRVGGAPGAGPAALVLPGGHADVPGFQPGSAGYVLGFNEFV